MEVTRSCERVGIHSFRGRSSWRSSRGIIPSQLKCAMLRGDSYLQENVLLNDKFHVQIADFGLTRLSEATNTRSGALHLNFAAPELLEHPDDASAGRTQMSDVYAFGCLCYEVSCDKRADPLAEWARSIMLGCLLLTNKDYKSLWPSFEVNVHNDVIARL